MVSNMHTTRADISGLTFFILLNHAERDDMSTGLRLALTCIWIFPQQISNSVNVLLQSCCFLPARIAFVENKARSIEYFLRTRVP